MEWKGGEGEELLLHYDEMQLLVDYLLSSVHLLGPPPRQTPLIGRNCVPLSPESLVFRNPDVINIDYLVSNPIIQTIYPPGLSLTIP